MKRIFWILLVAFLPMTLSARSIFRIEGNNIIVDLEGNATKSKVLKIEIWSNSTIKIVSGMSKEFSTKPSLITHSQPQEVKFKATYSGSGNTIEISTKNLIINIEEDGLVRIFARTGGNKLLIESDRYFTPSQQEENAYAIKQRFYLSTHEHIYGLGQAGDQARYSLRNSKFEIKQTVDQIASPVLISEKGYAMIWDNYSQTAFEDAKSGLTLNSEVADEIQYFFIYGPSWDQIVSEIRTISGKVPMLPRWMFGFWHSPMAYNNEEQLNAAVQKYTDAKIPIDINPTKDYLFYAEELNALTKPQPPRFASVGAVIDVEEKFSAYKTANPERRLTIPTHNAFPGIQRFGTYLRAGKIPSGWETLKNQIGAGINLALTGQPYWSTNIGGIAESGQTIDPELLTRWYQFAAFTPVFQANEANREIWNWSKPGDGFFEAASQAVRLRYSLLPYTYSMVNRVSSEDYTMMRSLLFDFMSDEQVHELNNQYLFGPSLMVCPITTPNKTQKEVYLPKGTNWVNFWTGETLTGGTKVSFPTTIQSIPLFVKCGSIIPINCKPLCEADTSIADLEIRVYAGADGKFLLYDDHGDGFGYETGQFSKIAFSYSEKDHSIEIGSIEGNFNQMKTTYKFNIVLVSTEKGIGAKPTPATTMIDYKGKKVKAKL